MATAPWHRLRAATDPLPRCQPDDACPRCWEGQPCGRDELVRRIAPGAGNWRWHNGKLETGYSINHWLAAQGDQGWFVHRHNRARRGGSVRGAFAGPELADAVLGWLLRTYRAHGEDTEPAKVVAHQINRVIEAGGCGDPWFWEMVALEWARPGREADLVAAIDACENGLRQCPEGTTASAWTALRTTCEMLRLRLLAVQRGHEIRHHPGPRAKRTRPLRFA